MVTKGDSTLQYVFPSKQKAVQAAINLAKADSRIERLILFGSAVTMNCGAASDIDIAIDAPNVSEEDFLKIARSFYLGVPSELDVVHYNRITNPLLKSEIDRKGVVMYSKCV
ncbi:MAG: nucleotidyltransferase domain-containing protein [Clostridia bacterium]|nr:nucleotidyltransferase domain-containing protein [Clostridia bacterium]